MLSPMQKKCQGSVAMFDSEAVAFASFSVGQDDKCTKSVRRLHHGSTQAQASLTSAACSKAPNRCSASWAPETAYSPLKMKNGTPVMPMARA